MRTERIVKPAFAVIGKEGSTKDGEGFIQRLWADANANFAEVAALAKRNPDGTLAGIWGAMSDESRTFMPWEDGFSKGLYLAGVECIDEAEAPEGWVKWHIPGYEYLKAEADCPDLFLRMIEYMEQQGMALAGAVHDFTDPSTGKNYMCFPVKKL